MRPPLVAIAAAVALLAAPVLAETPSKPLERHSALASRARARVTHASTVDGVVTTRQGRQIRLQTRPVSPVHSPLARTGVAEEGRAPSTDPDWFATEDKGGYGWVNGNTETMFGVYGRQPDPALHDQGIAPEGKSAAGLSISLKLGQ